MLGKGGIHLQLESLVVYVPLFLLAISVHEYAHAYVAVRLGDPTPRYQGRLTLNFTRHISLVGTLMLVLFGLGWAKPVQVNARNLKHPVRDMFWIALAGPLANIGLAILFSFLFHTLQGTLPFSTLKNTILTVLFAGVQLNVLLFLFNLLPIPPLDGSKILARYVPSRWHRIFFVLDQYGILILFLLLYFLNLRGILGRLMWLVMQLFGFS